ncbi:MAG: class I SAM-dependent RNA methyltransferase [Chloroflexi bacterium]|nr:class I SAM-dependent RNA methyltransferase [Chloroflexota bacterium]
MSGETLEVEIIAMAHGGSGLGRAGKRTVFVPRTIPGERVLARVTQDKGRVLLAEGLRLLEASADRVYPRCAHFGKGCCSHWQHIDYPAQLLLKQDVLADQLQRVGELPEATIAAALRPLIASPLLWGYNHHMTLHAAPDGQLGLPAAAAIVPLDECALLHPDLWALYEALELELDGLKRLRLQIGTEGDHMLILSMADDQAPALEADIAASVNLLLEDNTAVNLIGDLHTRCAVRGRMFRVTAGSSVRANFSQYDNLISTVVALLAPAADEHILDLYGGAGFFSAFIAPHAAQVTLVDSYAPAVTDAKENLGDFHNVSVRKSTVEAALNDLSAAAAVLDPLPAGLSIEAIDALGARKLSRLVYVSSDPATLARDAQRLLRHGYRLQVVQPLDLAPHTYYIDSVALFTR